MKVAFVLTGGNQICKLCLMMESTIAGKKCVFMLEKLHISTHLQTSVPILCSDNFSKYYAMSNIAYMSGMSSVQFVHLSSLLAYKMSLLLIVGNNLFSFSFHFNLDDHDEFV